MKKNMYLTLIVVMMLTLTGCATESKDVIEEVGKDVEQEVEKVVDSALDSSDKKGLEIATKGETGEGTLELVESTITTKDDAIEFKTKGIDEEKVVYIYVANKLVFEQKVKNNEVYTLKIKDIKNAHRTDYKPRVQLVQTMDDTENGDIVTFKEVKYSVEE